MLLSVIIPTLNGQPQLRESLPFLFNALKSIPDYEVIVVDNNSTDDTVAFLKHNYPEIILQSQSHNTGFTGAVNAGARVAQGTYLLILNNDCLVQETTLTSLISFLNDHKEYVATHPILYNTRGDIEQIGYVIDLYKGKANVIQDKTVAQHHDFPKKLFHKHRFLYGISATCLLIQSEVFQKVGMFDESFHSYLEDVDLSIRLAKNGYRYAYCLTATATHYHMATSSKMGTYKEQHDLTNWVRIIFNNYPQHFLMRHFFTLFVERLRNMNGLLKKLVTIYLCR